MIIPIRCPDLPDVSDRLLNPFGHVFPNDGNDGDPSVKGLRFGIHGDRFGGGNRRVLPLRPDDARQRQKRHDGESDL